MRYLNDLVVFTFICLILQWLTLAAPLQAATPGSRSPAATAITAPVDFDACARLSLRQSPYLTSSSLEIEVRRMDETDSRSDFLPTMKFRVRYYPVKPASAERLNSQDYSVELASDSYNPLAAYYTLQAKKLITQIAVTAHKKVIAEGLQSLGRGFMQMDGLKRLAVYQEELIALAKQHLHYLNQRLKLGEVTSLEVQIASQELELAQAEQERLVASKTKVLEGIKTYLGLKAGQSLELDVTEARRQVLGSFDASQASLDQARDRSFDLRIGILARELQTYNITMAKVRLLPDLYMGIQTPDPLSSYNVRGVFFSVGLSWDIPFLDGFKRFRNISRQKTILRQREAEVEEKTGDLQDKWLEAKEKVRSNAAALKMAQAQEELARLKERQSDIRYHAGEPYSVLVAGRKTYLEAKINRCLRIMENDLAILALCHLTGDLVYRYVDESNWNK